MVKTLKELGDALLGQVYNSMIAGADGMPARAQTFISWCVPGFAFQPRDFDFAALGIGTTDVDEQRRRQMQSFQMSVLSDMIPDVDGIYNDKRREATWQSVQARLSFMYGETLRSARVVNYKLTKDEENARNALREKYYDPSAVAVYNEGEAAYNKAVRDFTTARAMAQVSTDPAVVATFTAGAPLMKGTISQKLNDWIANGKLARESAAQQLRQYDERSLLIWKQQLQALFDPAVAQLSTAEGVSYYPTYPIPGNFANSVGWTSYLFRQSHTNFAVHSSTNSWSGGVSVNFGFFSVGGGGNNYSSHYTEKLTIENFDLSMDVTQVLLYRPWFAPEFFLNRGWDLLPGMGWTYANFPSDGAVPPTGVMVGFPSRAVFVKNVRIASSEFRKYFMEHREQSGGSGGIGWGPFRIGGGAGHTSYDKTLEIVDDGTGISIPGMQLIAFVNQLIPKSPNLDPSIEKADLV